MASSIAYSPKEWEVWVIGEGTCGTTANAASGMYQLDVDGISMPSLNVTQSLSPRSSGGRTLKSKDFFQDNNLRVVEISLSGIFHDDVGHKGLFKNITSEAGENFTVPTGYSPEPLKYGQTSDVAAADFDTFTLVLKSPDPTDNTRNIEMSGCVVTNLTLSSDINSDGGQYKWSATIQTGSPCDFADNTDSGGTAYVNTDLFKLSSVTGVEIYNAANLALNSFTLTIDNPAVFIGNKLDTGGYEIINRGQECSVTVDCQIKYDDDTKGFINDFDTQTQVMATDFMFQMAAASAGGIIIRDGVFTNVAFSEGDVMMLDCSIKALDNGAALLDLDF